MKKANPIWVDNITDHSQQLKDDFLEYYAEGSHRQCVNAIRQLVRITDKNDFPLLSYSDLKNFETVYPRGQGSNFSLVENFFKYLYCYDYLRDLNDFKKAYWSKELLQSDFEIQKEKVNNPHAAKAYSPKLSFKDIEKLIAFCDNVSDDDADNLRLAFCFYMLFYEGVAVSALKKLDASSYKEGCFIINDKSYTLPDKYVKMFSKIGARKNSKFSIAHLYINDLGKKLNISDNLTPSDIQDAHKNSLFMCHVCGNKYLCFTDEWRSLNNRILCASCYDSLIADNVKKNTLQNDIKGTVIDVISFDDNKTIEYATNSYEKLLDKMAKPINFESLHKYLAEIGRLGEKYVYESEKKRLFELENEYWELVDDTPAKDHHNGYDILSFNEIGEKIYIEVKATKSSDISEPFFITENERNKAQEIKAARGIYQIHRVLNVFNKESVFCVIYEDIENGAFNFKEVLYKVTPIE